MPEPSSPAEYPATGSTSSGKGAAAGAPAELLVSLQETVSLAHAGSLPALASLLRRLTIAVHSLPPSENVIVPMAADLRRLCAVMRSSVGAEPSEVASAVREVVRDLGRSLGILMLEPAGVRDGMAALHREMMAARFEGPEGRWGGPVPDLEEAVVRIKSGEEMEGAIAELGFLVREGLVREEDGPGVVSVLVNRLGSIKDGNRLRILSLLRSLAALSEEDKEMMTSIGALSNIVRSLSREADERREAVGLLLDLSEISKVRQRLGRVQGCIVMLVAMLNGDDPIAACDSGKILGSLSSNTQNVLLMAEAGFFVPLVQYLKEGSDMNKILMASAISRMEITDLMKASLGEEGSIKALVKMFTNGKLEAKLSALGALRNLSTVKANIPRLISAGIVPPLLQLLFSVTSVLMTLREPASAILASISQSELILTKKGVASQMLSLLGLSSPAIQCHLLRALNNIASHPNASKIRAEMEENGAVQLLLPLLAESNTEIRVAALSFLYTLSKDFTGEMADLVGENHLNILVDIISSPASENEKAASVGILSNIPVNDKKVTELFKRKNLLPVLISLVEVNITKTSVSTRRWLLESIAGVLVRFTIPSDKKLQRLSASRGIIPCLLKLLSCGSVAAKAKAATSLAQLSQNSLALGKIKSPRWFCVPQPAEAFCEVHNSQCTVKTAFCLVKAGAIPPLVQVLEGKEREADEAALSALATLLQDEIWECGCSAIEKASGVQAIIGVLKAGSLKAQMKAVWMLEKFFRINDNREKYGEAAQVLLIDLAQEGDPTLKPTIAKILAHLQLLQMQSSYF
ncbi:putative armadillo-like helical protein [Dioscorea sansibarensis]